MDLFGSTEHVDEPAHKVQIFKSGLGAGGNVC